MAIARALATNVDIILADEPTGNLDEEMEQEIVEIFKLLAHEHNKCVIVVTHSQEIALQSDKAFVLKKEFWKSMSDFYQTFLVMTTKKIAKVKKRKGS